MKNNFVKKQIQNVQNIQSKDINTIYIQKQNEEELKTLKKKLHELEENNARLVKSEDNLKAMNKHLVELVNHESDRIIEKEKLLMHQSKLAAMGEMIGMIAHQWRQPIASIAMDANNMMLDMAVDTLDNAGAEVYAKDILDQTEHLSKTIDDFRNFFKPDKLLISVKLHEIMEETLKIVKDSLENNGIAFISSYASEAEVNVYPRELMQVFVNIINNARDALTMHPVKNALIEVNLYDDECYVNAEICDNGVGIDDAIFSKLFDPYFSSKDDKTGTGLGLYMSKMILEEHLHGTIEASNRKGGGACFRVRLLKKNDEQSIYEM